MGLMGLMGIDKDEAVQDVSFQELAFHPPNSFHD
jgi:hypothetical protein